MQEIGSKSKTVAELFYNTKYNLDYYQREYVWKSKHVEELIGDLTNEFSKHYKSGDERKEVGNYAHYFLGSIIICEKDNKKFIVDGQQRLTTLTLLLIFLYHSVEAEDDRNNIAPLIASTRFGVRSFNLDICDRKTVMDALYPREALAPLKKVKLKESIRNIISSYECIKFQFKSQLGDKLSRERYPYFADWLLEKVCLVRITTSVDEDAYTVFETMNDRGISLTPTEMLRGYLLSKITDPKRRNKAMEIWDKRIQQLKEIGKNEEAEGIKAWLRSQYARNTKDFDDIGSSFHRWVRDRKDDLKLHTSADFADFIECDFKFYIDWYRRLRKNAEDLFKDGLECVYYNSQHNNNKFTLQYPILLAPLSVDDLDVVNLEKAQIVAAYLDILIYRRIWNSESIAQNRMADLLPPMIQEIRGRNAGKLRERLYTAVQNKTKPFEDKKFHLNPNNNRRKIFLTLARMTNYIEMKAEGANQQRYHRQYMRKTDPYEIEHILPHFSKDKFSSETKFEEYQEDRNLIGGLLLLPKSVNASLQNKSYVKKREVYMGQNLLAKSLHENAYKNVPRFGKFREKSGLNFKPHPQFTTEEELKARQSLYIKLADQVWNLERLRKNHGTDIKVEEAETSRQSTRM